jgi:hypothetical protein
MNLLKNIRPFETMKKYIKTEMATLYFYLIGVIILIVTYFICQFKNIPLALLFRDPTSSGGLPFYAGWISSLGVVFWTAGSSIMLFSSYFLKNIEKRYFLSLGILMMLLLIDDFFMLHDGLFGVLHIPEIFMYSLYAFFAIRVFILGRKLLLPAEIFQILTAFGFLGLSIIIDIFQSYFENHIPNRILMEDGFKLLGAIGLFCHSLTISLKQLNFYKK